MVKALFLITRKDGMSHEAFCEYWETEHIPLALEHPHLRRYATAVPTDPEAAPIDGVAKLTFDSERDLRAGLLESDIAAEAKDDALTFTDPDESTMVVLEETVHLDETGDDGGGDD